MKSPFSYGFPLIFPMGDPALWSRNAAPHLRIAKAQRPPIGRRCRPASGPGRPRSRRARRLGEGEALGKPSENGTLTKQNI